MNSQYSNIIRSCSYQNSAKVEEAVFQLCGMFPKLKLEMTKIPDGQFQRAVVELKGDIPVFHGGLQYFILTQILFPSLYPTAPPFVRIKNVDPNRFMVNDVYIKNYTPQDHYVTLELQQIKGWQRHFNCLYVMNELIEQLGKNFPFLEKKNQNFNYMPSQMGVGGQMMNPMGHMQQMGQMNPNNQQFYNPMGGPQVQPQQSMYNQPYYNPQSQFNQQQQPQYNPQSQFQKPPQQFQQSGFPQNPLQGFQQQQQQQQIPQQIPLQQQQMNPLGGNFGTQSMLMMKNKSDQEISFLVDPLISDIKDMKKTLCDTYEKKSFVDLKSILLRQAQESHNEKSQNLQRDIEQTQQFVKIYDGYTVNRDNLQDFVTEDSPLSNQIIDLVAENQAILDTLNFLQDLFKKEKIDREKFLEIYRQLSIQEFNNKELLKKCALSQ